MRKQSFVFRLKAPCNIVYEALLEPYLLSKWRVPDHMTMAVHHFDPKVGGKFRISLIYEGPESAGKSDLHTDTYHGYFKTLIPDRKIVEVIEFETEEQRFAGEMIITTQLFPENGGTRLEAIHENLPLAISESDNELGWKVSLEKLNALLKIS